MDIIIRQVVPEDLDAVARVEAVCFPEAEEPHTPNVPYRLIHTEVLRPFLPQRFQEPYTILLRSVSPWDL